MSGLHQQFALPRFGRALHPILKGIKREGYAMFPFGRKKKEREPQPAQKNEQVVDVKSGSHEDDFFSQLTDIQSGLVELVLEGLQQVGRANEPDAIYIYAYLGDDRPIFDGFCLINGTCEELPDMLGDALFGRVFGIALVDLQKLQGVFRDHGQQIPVELRGRYDARTGGYQASFPHDAFDRGPKDAGIFDRLYGWIDDVNAGKDDLAG